MSDLIYRRDAIDTVRKGNVKEVTPAYLLIDKAETMADLRQLPSAEPEPEQAIKDCRNCKHGNYNDHWDTYFCYYSGDCNNWDKWEPSVEPEPEYEPVKAEDFAKMMSENTLYSFMAWHGEALALMKEQGFVICKKIR